jgi:hypothetical protein
MQFFFPSKSQAKSSTSVGEESATSSESSEEGDDGDDDMDAETANVWEEMGELNDTNIMVRNTTHNLNPLVLQPDATLTVRALIFLLRTFHNFSVIGVFARSLMRLVCTSAGWRGAWQPVGIV